MQFVQLILQDFTPAGIPIPGFCIFQMNQLRNARLSENYLEITCKQLPWAA